MPETKTIELVNCPMDRAMIGLVRCRSCVFHRRLVGCMELGRSVPEDYCTRHCPHQAGDRGKFDGTEGPQADGGPARQAPLAGPAMCGAPKVIAKCGGVRPIFENIGGLDAIENPRDNVKPACSFPKELHVGRALLEV